MVSSLMSLDMEWAGQILGTGTCTLAGRSSSLDTCFRFLENHSRSHTWARFRFKARPVTTVSVYNKTSRSLPLNMEENVLEIGPHFYPEGLVQLLSLLVSRSSLVTHSCRNLLPHVHASKDRQIPGIPHTEGSTEESRPPNSEFFYKHIVGMPVGSFNQRHVGPACHCDSTMF